MLAGSQPNHSIIRCDADMAQTHPTAVWRHLSLAAWARALKHRLRSRSAVQMQVKRRLASVLLPALLVALGPMAGLADGELPIVASGPTLWSLDRGLVRLTPEGDGRRLSVVEPDQIMIIAGLSAGSLIFDGRVNGAGYTGTGYFYAPECGRVAYPASAEILDGGGALVVSGKVPVRHPRTCAVIGARRERAVLRLLRLE